MAQVIPPTARIVSASLGGQGAQADAAPSAPSGVAARSSAGRMTGSIAPARRRLATATQVRGERGFSRIAPPGMVRLGASGSTGLAPVFSVFTPPSGSQLGPKDTVSFYVDFFAEPTGVFIVAEVPDNSEWVFNFTVGTFGKRYRASTFSRVGNRISFVLRRQGGWPSGWRLHSDRYAFDTAGNAA
jgi:hypothetical protein